MHHLVNGSLSESAVNDVQRNNGRPSPPWPPPYLDIHLTSSHTKFQLNTFVMREQSRGRTTAVSAEADRRRRHWRCQKNDHMPISSAGIATRQVEVYRNECEELTWDICKKVNHQQNMKWIMLRDYASRAPHWNGDATFNNIGTGMSAKSSERN